MARSVVFALVLTACVQGERPLDRVGPDLPIEPALQERLDAGEPTTVLVTLDTSGIPAMPGPSLSALQRNAAFRLRKSALAERVDPFVRAMPADLQMTRRYGNFAVVAVDLDATEGLDWLLSRSEVVAIEEERVFEVAYDTTALDLIAQPAVAADGLVGAGTSVVVIDTGADYTHADLGSCTGVATGAGCRVVYSTDFANDDGQLDDNGHGTNVAAIVAGVAPGADIISLDVFTGGSGFSTDVLEALDWVVDNADTYDIASVNMSLGSGAHTAPCNDTYSSAIDAVRAAGVSVVIASGNNAYTNAVASPACNAQALSVGAVYDAPRSGLSYSACSDSSPTTDQVTCFSNSASFLDVLAPGALISGGGYNMAGTSQAAPHVAGAMAVLRSAFPDATLAELEQMVTESGTTLTDHRNGLTFPRLDLAAAVAYGGDPTAQDPDPDPEPATLEGTLVIDDDAVGTRSTRVTLSLEAEGATQMCITNADLDEEPCEDWEEMDDSLSWRLASGAGLKTVTAVFRDDAGTTSAPASDTIVYDRVRPSRGTLAATAGPASVQLAWDGFEDASPGITSYRVMQTTGTRSPSNCTSTDPVWEGLATELLVEGLTDGQDYAFTVCAVDGASNLSSGAKATARPVPESDAPVGTVVVDDGAEWTNAATVTLALAATDASGVAEVCVAKNDRCRRWVDMTSEMEWAVRGNGEQRIFVSYRDTWGNESAPVVATIGRDSRRPANGHVNAVPAIDGVALSWSGFTDADSGVASYEVYTDGSDVAPRACSGTPAWVGSDTAAVISGLTEGAEFGFRVCAVDRAGNRSTGSTAVGSPAPEVDVPVGSLVLNDGAYWATRTTVTATLDAADASGVTHACLSNTDSCRSWFSMRDSKSWGLGSTQGERTVTAWFKDAHGNISTPVTATIWLDSRAPVDGEVDALAGDGSVALSWSGFDDAVSGIVGYRVAYTTGTRAPRDCNGEDAWEGTDPGVELSGLENGVVHQVRVCAVDLAGHVSRGTVVEVIPAPELDPPTGTVLLAGGDTHTGERTVTVDLTAADASGVAEACLSTREDRCTQWFDWSDPEATEHTTTFRLPSGSATRTVYASFKDIYGNVALGAASDDIDVDMTRPRDGEVVGIHTTSRRIEYDWTGFEDDGAGVDHYLVAVHCGTTAPSTCDPDDAFLAYGEHLALTVGRNLTYAARVCAVDSVGNISRGSTITVEP